MPQRRHRPKHTPMVDKRQRAAARKERRRQRGSRSLNEPILIFARRPGAPSSRRADSQVSGRRPSAVVVAAEPAPDVAAPPVQPAPRRSARIVQSNPLAGDAADRERSRLLARLMASEGRIAITRAAREYRQAGFEFPIEQGVMLQLLEHIDEALALAALTSLTRLLEAEPPLKRPVLLQRLRRLEEYAEDCQTREAAAALRRALRDQPAGATEP
jgi:hypothetical protein